MNFKDNIGGDFYIKAVKGQKSTSQSTSDIIFCDYSSGLYSGDVVLKLFINKYKETTKSTLTDNTFYRVKLLENELILYKQIKTFIDKTNNRNLLYLYSSIEFKDADEYFNFLKQSQLKTDTGKLLTDIQITRNIINNSQYMINKNIRVRNSINYDSSNNIIPFSYSQYTFNRDNIDITIDMKKNTYKGIITRKSSGKTFTEYLQKVKNSISVNDLMNYIFIILLTLDRLSEIGINQNDCHWSNIFMENDYNGIGIKNLKKYFIIYNNTIIFNENMYTPVIFDFDRGVVKNQFNPYLNDAFPPDFAPRTAGNCPLFNKKRDIVRNICHLFKFCKEVIDNTTNPHKKEYKNLYKELKEIVLKNDRQIINIFENCNKSDCWFNMGECGRDVDRNMDSYLCDDTFLNHISNNNEILRWTLDKTKFQKFTFDENGSFIQEVENVFQHIKRYNEDSNEYNNLKIQFSNYIKNNPIYKKISKIINTFSKQINRTGYSENLEDYLKVNIDIYDEKVNVNLLSQKWNDIIKFITDFTITEKLNRYFIDFFDAVRIYKIIPNCHHRQDPCYHALWTARQADIFIMKNTFRLGQKLDKKWKLLTIAGAMFHDIGKDDGQINKTTKVQHPQYGADAIQEYVRNNTIRNEMKSINILIRFCKDKTLQRYFNENENGLFSYFTAISYFHQKLGNYIQNYTIHGRDPRILKEKIIDKFINEYINYFPKVTIIGNRRTFLQLFISVLIISLSDVKGAWRIEPINNMIPIPILSTLLKDNNITNQFNNCPNPNKDCNILGCTPPWETYVYKDKKITELVTSLISYFEETFMNAIPTIYNISIPNVSKFKFDLIKIKSSHKYTFIKGTSLTPEEFKLSMPTYDKVSWFARKVSTPTLYINTFNARYTIEVKLKKGENLILIRLDNPNNIKELVRFFEKVYSPTPQNIKIRDDFVQSFRTVLQNGGEFVVRESNYQNDIDICNVFLCNITQILNNLTGNIYQIDGYSANELFSSGGGIFHEELMICHPNVKLRFVRGFDTESLIYRSVS